MRAIALLAFAAVAVSGAKASDIACSDIDPLQGAFASSRPIVPADLIRLRDIGWSNTQDAPLSVSPDGQRVAFSLRRASIDKNDYCFAMIVVNLAGGGTWRRVDTGGQEIKLDINYWGTTLPVSNGMVQSPVAKWSPDGRWIAYLRRDGGVTQVWRADIAGGHAEPLTRSSLDIVDFAWIDDGRMVISTRPALIAEAAAIKREALTGFHYDDRYYNYESRSPLALDRGPPLVQRFDIATREVLPSVPSDGAMLHGAVALTAEAVVPPSPDGLQVQTVPADPQRIFFADELRITDRDGARLPCVGPDCVGRFTGEWWDRDGSLIIQKRDGWARSRSSFYRWTRTDPVPRLISSTDDLITGCQKAGRQLICSQEGSLQPRRIVSIDLERGETRSIYDPNPEWAGLQHLPAQRLFWKNKFGLETFGDLVLPAHRRAGEKLPLIVVTYLSRGFLRGGVGDEIPIQLFAQAGFAVLSFQLPRDIGELKRSRTDLEFMKNDFRHLAHRRSVQSSLELGIGMLVRKGLVDPARIGLTGLSEGSALVQFALINSHLAAAAGMAHCCEGEQSGPILGPDIDAHNQSFGTPDPATRGDAYWERKSIVRAANRIEIPILVQISEEEYLEALPAWAALRARDRPIDMYVYQGEQHIKSQPVHRLAVYQRYLAWFAFWLQNRTLPEINTGDLNRWQEWKDLMAQPQGLASAVPSPRPRRVPRS